MYKNVLMRTLLVMEREVSLSEARATLPALLDRVATGEEVTITRHGKAVAVMVRPDSLRSRRAAEAMASAQRIADAIERAGQRPLGKSQLSAERAEELVAEVRASRRRR